MEKKGFDGRSMQARNARNYAKVADFFALPLTAGNVTIFRIVSAEQFADMLKRKETRALFAKSSDGLRWKGLQVVHAPHFDYVASVTIGRKLADFEESNGNKSEAMEKAVAAALTLAGFMNESWRRSTEEDRNEANYLPDVIGENFTIEVKGKNGRIFR